MAGKDSIFRISGTGKGFGTGFVIWQEGNLSYLLTCAHVAEDAGGEGNMKAGGCEAQLVACGSRNGADLAILQAEGLNAPPLLLRDAGRKDMEFSVAGFTEFDRKQGQFVFRPLRGVLGNQIFFESDQGGSVAAWDLKIEDDFFLKPGYSGSPVFDEATGEVFAVASHSQTDGKKGHAVSVTGLEQIWREMPAELLSGIRKSSKVYESRHQKRKLSFREKSSIVSALLECPNIRDIRSRDEILKQLPPKIYDAVAYSPQNKIHVMNIVDTCLRYSGGLAEFVDILRYIEEDSEPMQNLDSLLSQIFPEFKSD